MPQVNTEVVLRIRPATPQAGCPKSYPHDKVDQCVEDHATCSTWCSELGWGIAMMVKLTRGRHVRARTFEYKQEEVNDAFVDMCAMLKQPRWQVPKLLSDGWPLPASLELLTSSAVHFLCLLRGRLANGTIVADVWKTVVRHALPTVLRFGYTPAGSGPWVVLQRFPPLPSERVAAIDGDQLPERRVLVEGLLGNRDARANEALCHAWCGQGGAPVVGVA